MPRQAHQFIKKIMKAKDLWLEFSVSMGHYSVCGLCGNNGIVDTRDSAMTPRGVSAGIRSYCICPNGRALKKHKHPLQ